MEQNSRNLHNITSKRAVKISEIFNNSTKNCLFFLSKLNKLRVINSADSSQYSVKTEQSNTISKFARILYKLKILRKKT